MYDEPNPKKNITRNISRVPIFGQLGLDQGQSFKKILKIGT